MTSKTMILGENLLPAKKKKPPASPCSILSSFVLTTILISMQDMLAGSFVPLYVDKKFGPAFDATMVWKFFLVDFVRVDTDKLRFDPDRIWRAAVRRLETKISARTTFLIRRSVKAVGLDRAPPPPLDSETHTEPLVRYHYETLFPDFEVRATYSTAYTELLKQVNS